MAMNPAQPVSAAVRMEALERENAELREQLRRATAQQVVTRGAILEASQERADTVRVAHQVAVEERATRAAIAVQGNTIGTAVVLQIVNFFLLLVLAVGLYFWLPREISARVPSQATVFQQGYPNGTVVVPGR